MTGPPELYVPGRSRPPTGGSERDGPAPVYVPDPSPVSPTLSDRIRDRLRTAGKGELDPEAGQRHVLALFRDRDLSNAALRRLTAEARAREAATVAAFRPAGWLLGTALASRVDTPLVALRAGAGRDGGPGTGITGGEIELVGEPPPEGARVLLVIDVLSDGRLLRSAARCLEEAGAVMAGAVALVETGSHEEAHAAGSYDVVSLLELTGST